jgi:hypothetical protein
MELDRKCSEAGRFRHSLGKIWNYSIDGKDM